MYKFTMPSTKSSSFSFEGFPVPNDPNIPSCCENYFKEENFSKSPPSQGNALLNIRVTRPINLKIIPNSCTKVARKEQMQLILIYLLVAQNTKIIILNIMPMPTYKQVFSVKSIKE